MCGDMWRGRGYVVTYGCGDELVRGVCVGVVLGKSRDGERQAEEREDGGDLHFDDMSRELFDEYIKESRL
jgi:hypothetical protein